MDKLLVGFELECIETLFDKILHSLDIVVGGFLYFLDGKGILVGEIAVNVAQLLNHLAVGSEKGMQRQLGERAECNKILNLNTHTIADESPFGEERCKWFGFGAVATVDRGNCVKAVHGD